ncbi:MAG: adenylate/guanylate cyclase domain-containing protein, partial [Chromatiales bacterium]|nr:adenylate/guanylate cyclase domain-containing protein [Chromatiales bacterium]
PNQSAIGDNINIAARLEAQTKTLGRPVVVSMAALEMAGVVTGHLEHHRVAVRGRDEPLDVCTFDDAAALRTVVSQL